MNVPTTWVSLLCLVGFCGQIFGQACDFRVNNRVTNMGSKEDILDGKTLFHDGLVYDYLGQCQQVAVFNFEKKVIYILDLQKREKVRLPMDQVEAYVAEYLKWGKTNEKPEVRDYMVPKFAINFDNQKNEYSFKSPVLEYQVIPIKPSRDGMLEEYRRFADMSCKVGMMLNPAAKTLPARMIVNEIVFKSGSLIEQLQLEIEPQRRLFPKKEIFVSHQQYLPRLVESDLASIRQLEEFIAIYKDVTFAEFRTER
ncbi:MAG: hypothetical protein Q4D98_07265 [Planctomycetia bacterium]|nr:hypothetical protein [Planctomycetia bacterium]